MLFEVLVCLLSMTACPALGSSHLRAKYATTRGEKQLSVLELPPLDNSVDSQPDVCKDFNFWGEYPVREHTDQAWGWEWNSQLWSCESVCPVHTKQWALTSSEALDSFN